MRQVAPLVVVEDDVGGGRGRGGCRHHGTPTVAAVVAAVVVVGGGLVVVVVVVSMVNIVAWCDNSGVVNRKRLWWRSKSSRGRLKEPLLIVAEVSVKEKCVESIMDDDGIYNVY